MVTSSVPQPGSALNEVRSKRPRGSSAVAGAGSVIGARSVTAAGAVQTAQTAHGAHCGAGGATMDTAGGGGDAQVANSMASIDENSKMAERWKLEKRGVADDFIVSRVYNCKSNCRLAMTI